MEISIQEFVSAWNAQRKANKDKWIAFGAPVSGIGTVAVKSHGTWIQIVRADCVPWRGEGPMDAPVKTATAWLEKYLHEVSKHAANAR